MALNHPSRNEYEYHPERQHRRRHGSSSTLSSSSSTSAIARPLSHSDPILQNEWVENLSSVYALQDRQDRQAQLALPLAPHQIIPAPLFSRPLSLPLRGVHEQSHTDRQGWRPDQLHCIAPGSDHHDEQEQMNPSSAHSQRRSHGRYGPSYLSSDELEPQSRRVMSQPGTPAYWQQTHRQSSIKSPLDGGVRPPRSPTYPPTTTSRRQVHGAAATIMPDYSTFTDEEEFRLFAQATAGLGPEQAYRNNNNNNYPSSHPESVAATGSSARRGANSAAAQPSSPILETPTTLIALQQLAQLPQASSSSPFASRRVGRLDSPAAAVPVSQRASTAGVDLWSHRASPLYGGGGDDDDDDDDDDETDDELPNYAQSQAQAQAAYRAQAARRAEELHWRWLQSRR